MWSNMKFPIYLVEGDPIVVKDKTYICVKSTKISDLKEFETLLDMEFFKEQEEDKVCY